MNPSKMNKFSVESTSPQSTEIITKYLNLGAAAQDIIPSDPQNESLDPSKSALSLAIAAFGGEQSTSLPTDNIWIQQPCKLNVT